jgi:hypothetical protein
MSRAVRSIWRTPDQDWQAPFRLSEIHFSQDAEWKTLISRYIGAIPLSGDAAKQVISGEFLPRTPSTAP